MGMLNIEVCFLKYGEGSTSGAGEPMDVGPCMGLGFRDPMMV